MSKLLILKSICPGSRGIAFRAHSNPEARKEILKRLLELNHKIHEEEVAAGLWDKKKAVKKEKVVKKKGDVVSEPFEPYNQPELFGEDNLFSEEK